VVAIGAAIALSACTVQPLYGPTPTGEAVTTALDRITIDPVDTRIAQEVRNRLLFVLGGGRQASAAYRMKLTVTAAESALGVTPVETAPTYSITVSATYEIRSLATDEIVLRGTSRGIASFDRITQVYANTRAKLDAENRAAVQAATDIRIRLAAAAANGII
jgi:LPS-assembly lipoprotein